MVLETLMTMSEYQNESSGRRQEEQLRTRMLEDGLLEQMRLKQHIEKLRMNVGLHSSVLKGNGGLPMDSNQSIAAANNQLLSQLGSSALSPLLGSSLAGGLAFPERNPSRRNDLLALMGNLDSAANPLLSHQNQQIALGKQLLGGGLGGLQQRELSLLQQNPLLTPNMLRQAGGFDPLNPQLLNLHDQHCNPSLPSAQFAAGSSDALKVSGKRGVIEPFPEKLHRLLRECEATGNDDIIAFTADGKAFEIHKPDRLFSIIVPRYFKQSKLSSFKRQLNLYRFELITIGPSRGGYAHPNFQKYKPELCRKIRRRDTKSYSKEAASKDPPEEVPDSADTPSFASPEPVEEKIAEDPSETESIEEERE